MKRRRTALWSIGLLALLAAVSLAVLARVWQPLPPAKLVAVPELAAPLRTPEEHDALYGTHPCVIEIEAEGGGAVLVLGIRHTSESDDPQIGILRQRFAEFAPDRVLVEGRLGWHFGGRDSLLAAFGESGEAVALAHAAGVVYGSMEPDFTAEVRDAVAAFGAEKTLAFYALRVFVSERDQGVLGDALDTEAEALLQKRGARTGLANALPDLAALDRFWETHGVLADDWRRLPKQALWRNAGDAWTQRLAGRINAFRDRTFVASIVAAAQHGRRVLAVCGSSHAIIIQPALQAAL